MGLGMRSTQEKKGRFFTFAEEKSGTEPLLFLAGNLCRLEIRRWGHMVKQCLRAFKEAEYNGPVGEIPGRMSSSPSIRVKTT